ncbi:MAG TPA: hypothetical protein VFB89_14485 [Gemmatimonadales bacterium]|nr:hypothetical protein [Gemmatimonadales bacterium]
MVGGLELPLRGVLGDPSIDMRIVYMHQECAGTLGLAVRARYVLDFVRQRLLRNSVGHAWPHDTGDSGQG